jgi:crotonobetainyl-CoA:carnitine CoA-transferase CaiB-like acyl-CoA transferase
MMVHAASGFDRTLMRYAGDRDRPAPGAVFVADVLGAIFGFSAIQTALVQRSRTGVGQYIDVALMDCMTNLLVYELQEAQFPVATPRPVYAPVKAQDGDLLIAPITERNFSALCEATGLAPLRNDERFATLPSRNRNWQAMMDVVEGWTRERSIVECVRLLDKAGVPCSAYADPADTLTDAHLIERGLFQQVFDGAGQFTGINPPWRMSGTRAELGEHVPAVGEHTQEILDSILGMPPSEQARMRAAGAFGVREELLRKSL